MYDTEKLTRNKVLIFFLFVFSYLPVNSVYAKTAKNVYADVKDSIVEIRYYKKHPDIIRYDGTGNGSQSLKYIKGGFHKKPTLIGSGVVIKGNRIVTNCHVAREGGKVVIVSDKKEYIVKRVLRDHENDLCLLLDSGFRANAVRIASKNALLVGERVYVVGNPKGLNKTLSAGIISSFRDYNRKSLIQFTAPISPGSSGGGLFNDKSELFGITTFSRTGGQLLNFAIPASLIKQIPEKMAKCSQQSKEIISIRIRAINVSTSGAWKELEGLANDLSKYPCQEKAALIYLAEAYIGLSQYDDALEILHKRLMYSSDEEIYSLAGRAYYMASLKSRYKVGPSVDDGYPYKALEYYKKAVEYEPLYAKGYIGLADVYADLFKNYDKAFDAAKSAVEANKYSATSWNSLGGQYYNLGKYSLSLKAHKKAVDIYPEYKNAWFGVSMAAEELGDTFTSIAAIERVNELLRRERKERLKGQRP